jgi:hypothetical protein
MNTQNYFKVARSLGAFRAVDCLALAREAAELDRAAAARAASAAGPDVVAVETLPDGNGAVQLSFGVKVY